MNRSNSPTVPLKSIKLLFRQCPFHGSINLLWILALMTNAENLIVSTISIELSLVFMCCGSMDNVEIRKQPLTRKLIKTSIILLRDEITEWSAVRWWLIQKLLLSNACKTSYKFSYTKKSSIICDNPQQERDRCLTMNKLFMWHDVKLMSPTKEALR